MAKLNEQLTRWKAEVTKYERKLDQRRDDLDRQAKIVEGLTTLRDTCIDAWDGNDANWGDKEKAAIAQMGSK